MLRQGEMLQPHNVGLDACLRAMGGVKGQVLACRAHNMRTPHSQKYCAMKSLMVGLLCFVKEADGGAGQGSGQLPKLPNTVQRCI